MAIPTITAKDAIAAIHEIDRDGVPQARKSRHFQLVYKGRCYPPKYIISLAVRFATGTELAPDTFSGGVESNTLLTRLGFTIVDIRQQTPSADSQPHPAAHPRDDNALVGRIVVDGMTGSANDAEELLLAALTDHWPPGARVKFLITPGGFVLAELPETWSGNVSWDSTARDFKALCEHADAVLSQVLTKRVLREARNRTEVISIGIDLGDPENSIHAELVAVVEINTEKRYWTGKSYPVMAQEHDLIQVADIRTHLLRIAGERVLVLGCHDLNMFSARTLKNCNEGSIRHHRCSDMISLARRFNPTVVLQHPHTTDTPRIWSTAWSGVRSHCPSLKAWASGIGYVNRNAKPRASLKKVLDGTRSYDGVLDIVVKP